MSDTCLCQDSFKEKGEKNLENTSVVQKPPKKKKKATARSARWSLSHNVLKWKQGTGDLSRAPLCGPDANPRWERSGSHVRLVLRWKNATRAPNGCQWLGGCSVAAQPHPAKW